jgi:hypothetical protein
VELARIVLNLGRRKRMYVAVDGQIEKARPGQHEYVVQLWQRSAIEQVGHPFATPVEPRSPLPKAIARESK